MSLVLELRAGDRLIINGAQIRFVGKSRIAIDNTCRFVFGKQVLDEADADTPLRRLYLLLQRAYAEEPRRETELIAEARAAAHEVADTLCFALVVAAIEAAEDARWYQAMKLVAEAIGRDEAPPDTLDRIAAGCEESAA